MAPKHRPKHSAPRKFSLSAPRKGGKSEASPDGSAADVELGDGAPAARSRWDGDRSPAEALKGALASEGTTLQRRIEAEPAAERAKANGALFGPDEEPSAEDFWSSARPRRRGPSRGRDPDRANTRVMEAGPMPASGGDNGGSTAGRVTGSAVEPPVRKRPDEVLRSEPFAAAGTVPGGRPPSENLDSRDGRIARAEASEPLDDVFADRTPSQRRKPGAGSGEGRASFEGVHGSHALARDPDPARRLESVRRIPASPPDADQDRPYAMRSGRRKSREVVVEDEAPPSGKRNRKAENAETGGHGQSLGQWFKEIIILGVVAVGTAVLLTTYLVQAFFIPSESMENTLQRNDRVLVNKFTYKLGEPQRGDIIVFTSPDGSLAPPPANTPFAKFMDKVAIAIGLKSSEQDLIKRVIATEGQTIEAKLGLVFVDGQQLDEPYRKTSDPISDIPPLTVPEGHVFVLGDNRTDSRDSRDFGPIRTSSIIGKAFARIWPFERVAWFEL